MIDSLATAAIFIFTVAGITGAVMVGADALTSKGAPKTIGIGILTATALLFVIVAVWFILSVIA